MPVPIPVLPPFAPPEQAGRPTARAGGAAVQQERVETLKALRQLLSANHNPPLGAAVRCGAVPLLAECLAFGAPEEQLLEAAWCVTNIASGEAEETRAVLPCAALLIAHCTDSPSPAIAEQCVWAVGNIAAEADDLRAQLLDQGALPALTRLLLAAASGASGGNTGARWLTAQAPSALASLAKTVAWALSSLIKVSTENSTEWPRHDLSHSCWIKTVAWALSSLIKVGRRICTSLTAGCSSGGRWFTAQAPSVSRALLWRQHWGQQWGAMVDGTGALCYGIAGQDGGMGWALSSLIKVSEAVAWDGLSLHLLSVRAWSELAPCSLLPLLLLTAAASCSMTTPTAAAAAVALGGNHTRRLCTQQHRGVLPGPSPRAAVDLVKSDGVDAAICGGCGSVEGVPLSPCAPVPRSPSLHRSISLLSRDTPGVFFSPASILPHIDIHLFFSACILHFPHASFIFRMHPSFSACILHFPHASFIFRMHPSFSACILHFPYIRAFSARGGGGGGNVGGGRHVWQRRSPYGFPQSNSIVAFFIPLVTFESPRSPYGSPQSISIVAFFIPLCLALPTLTATQRQQWRQHGWRHM
ncbi:unnamed protein product [Closterium sp. NIES-54]